jgi:uncharacterized protein YndB with AHSA1/START domain
MDRGTYVEYEGRPAVRFERTYGHSVDRLWAAITEPDELSHWFPASVVLESRVGGKIEFAGDPHVEPTVGSVLVFEPPHRLSFTWGGDELHFELASVGDGCVLTLIDVLEAPDTAARNAAGWHVCLAELSKLVAGEVAAGPHSDTAAVWRPLYDGYVAAGLPSGAWFPGSSG